MSHGGRQPLFAALGLFCLAGCTGGTVPTKPPQTAQVEKVEMPFIRAAALEKEEAIRLAKAGSAKTEDGLMVSGQDKITEKELALPFYPGSQSLNDHKFDQKGKTTLVSIRSAPVEPLAAIDFYRDKLKVDDQGVIKDLDGQIAINGRLPDGRKVSVKAGTATSGGTVVSIVVVQS